MPFTADENELKLDQAIIDQFHTLFGKHAGIRPAHGKGVLVSGTFTPSAEAGKLSSAQHFNNVTPVLGRFSNSTGIPNIPDTDPNTMPKGLGLRFQLGDRKHTDIIGHSTPHFPVNNGEDFLKLFQAIGSTGPDSPHPNPVEQFLGTHPAALRFVTAPKPITASYASLGYFGLHAYKLIDSTGKATTVRWFFTPVEGIKTLSDEQIAAAGPDFHSEELGARFAKGEAVHLKLEAQIAEEGDVTNDVTVEWPEERKTVVLGEVKFDKLVENGPAESKYIIFDPVPRVDGVEAGDDPLIDFRANLYLLSGKARRQA